MSVEFRYACREDYVPIAEFLEQYWAKNHVYARKRELFDWTFGRSALWDHGGYSFALMEDSGELAGILGAIPFVFNSLGSSVRAVWFANLMVRPEYRRGPLPIRLLGMFRRPPYAVNAVAGISPQGIDLYRNLRWKFLGALPRHFAVSPLAANRMVRLLRLTHAEWEADRAESLVRFFTTRVDSAPTVEHCDGLPSTWDTRDWPAIASRTMGAVRDSDYLTWRYLNHPFFEYRVRTVAEGERTGLAVWRLETIRNRTITGLEEVDRIARLVEFLPVSRNNARNLWRRLWSDLIEADALGVDYYGYHPEWRAWLCESGFKATDGHPDGDKVPARFQPLDSARSSIETAVLLPAEVPDSVNGPEAPWYWTKSDGDQDRPN